MNRLKELREERKESLKEVSEALSMPYQTYRNYEINKRTPRKETWEHLANYFDVDVAYLMGLSDMKKDRYEIIENNIIDASEARRVSIQSREYYEAVIEYIFNLIKKEAEMGSFILTLSHERIVSMHEDIGITEDDFLFCFFNFETFFVDLGYYFKYNVNSGKLRIWWN